MNIEKTRTEKHGSCEFVIRTIDNEDYTEFDKGNAESCLQLHMKVYAIENDNLILCTTKEDLEKYKDNIFLCPDKEFKQLTKDIFTLPFNDPDIDMNF